MKKLVLAAALLGMMGVACPMGEAPVQVTMDQLPNVFDIDPATTALGCAFVCCVAGCESIYGGKNQEVSIPSGARFSNSSSVDRLTWNDDHCELSIQSGQTLLVGGSKELSAFRGKTVTLRIPYNWCPGECCCCRSKTLIEDGSVTKQWVRGDGVRISLKMPAAMWGMAAKPHAA